MRVFFTVIVTISCAAILILGNINWEKRTEIVVENNSSVEAVSRVNNAVPEEDNIERDEEEQEAILNLATNWPEQSRLHLAESLKSQQPFKILFVGSESLGEGEGAWPSILEKKLTEAYGDSVFVFKTLVYEMTTQEFMDENKLAELAMEKADLILFEPLVLKDNGKVVIETSLEYIETIMNEVKAEKPETTFILQPPHPFFKAGFYTVQVKALKDFAEKNSIPYLNHWEAWPDISSEEIKNYLTTEPSVPNEQGHALWAEYLAEYFISG